MMLGPYAWKLPPVLLLSVVSCSMEHPLGHSRSAVPSVSPHSLLPTPASSLGHTERNREALDAVRTPLSNSQNIIVLSAQFWSQIWKSIWFVQAGS